MFAVSKELFLVTANLHTLEPTSILATFVLEEAEGKAALGGVEETKTYGRLVMRCTKQRTHQPTCTRNDGHIYKVNLRARI